MGSGLNILQMVKSIILRVTLMLITSVKGFGLNGIQAAKNLRGKANTKMDSHTELILVGILMAKKN